MTMNSPQILIVVTSHRTMGNKGESTGVWLEELTTPYYAFIDGGVAVTIASINGGRIPVDPRSQQLIGGNPTSVDRFLQDKSASEAAENTPAVDTIDINQYDAIFLPGGHGTMWDLPQSASLTKIISQAYRENKIVAAVCHGPAGLVTATKSDGSPLVAGHEISAFTNSEEHKVGLADVVPFLLETKLRELGANFQGVDDFEPFAVQSGNVITGQNPSSSILVADKILATLKVCS